MCPYPDSFSAIHVKARTGGGEGTAPVTTVLSRKWKLKEMMKWIIDVMVTASAGGQPLSPCETPGVAAEDRERDQRRVPPDQDRPALQGGSSSDSQGASCVEARRASLSSEVLGGELCQSRRQEHNNLHAFVCVEQRPPHRPVDAHRVRAPHPGEALGGNTVPGRCFYTFCQDTSAVRSRCSCFCRTAALI